MEGHASVGIVIPAYRPDVRRLISYIHSLQDKLDPETIRVELDDPLVADIPREIATTGATVDVSGDRRGKGAAITAGFEELDTDVLMFLDADGATPVTSAVSILRPIRDGVANVSIGSRRHPASRITAHRTIVRRRLGNVFARIARTALDLDVYDTQCGAKAVSSHAWEIVRLHLYEEGFAWDFELLGIASAYGLEIAEIPIRWEDQPGSTVDPIDTIIDFSRALPAIRHRAKSIEGHRVHTALPQSRSRTLVADD